ncbi:hypothetical protein PILCRDRAFT_9023 [Piloderma croceum F 1598]|uniref:Uncharacterized protein n=1 Tax=Piloderma croceum (strain F 1598) TaxID=765440 RepID=A0A0C3B434_PILCF|nr:hypothetical protein PILCRDRAFT_9023 [Piloderma croceum F 1598]
MLHLEITEDKNHDPMLVISLLTLPHPTSHLRLQHSVNGVPHARLFIIFSHIALSHVATLSSTFHQWSTPVHTRSLNSLPHIPHPASQCCLQHAVNGVPPCMIIEHSPSHCLIPRRNFVFDIPSMEYPRARSSNILPHIASSRVATLSLTLCQWSTSTLFHFIY